MPSTPPIFTRALLNQLTVRTHRQRTQRYIRALENEVLRLRSLEKATREKNVVLQRQLDAFLKSGASSVTDALEPATPAQSEPMVHVDLTKVLDITPEKACSDLAAERIPVEVDYSSLTPITPQSDVRRQEDIADRDLSPSTISLSAQTGLDFVLA
jgi:hypothetical protein